VRWPHFILLQCLLIAAAGAVIYIHRDRVILIKKPPASLAQWYRPENKRQVWLHNMFKLRREMQAARFYSDNEDAEHLQKWVARLSEHYLKIGEMVPEWSSRLDRNTIARLQAGTESGSYQEVSSALDQLAESCSACHNDYRATTAVLYRAPDFSSLEFDSRMQALSTQVNQIKIASEDGMKRIALSSLAELKQGLDKLGETCSGCHKKEQQPYPGKKIGRALATLEQRLAGGTPREQGQALGELAVLACAHCHGTHRLAYDSRKLMSDEQSWLELLKHY